MKFEGFIAWKHLTKRHKTGFISLISLISITGVAVGVMALIVVLGVMSGFDRELKFKIVNVQPHLRIEKVGGVDQADRDTDTIRKFHLSNLEFAAPYVEGQAILKSASGAMGVMVKGLDPAAEDMAIYRKNLVSGKLDLSDWTRQSYRRKMLFFKRRIEETKGSLLIGENLASILRVHIGDEIQLISPFQAEKSLLPGQAQKHTFVVKGIFRIGMNDFDTSLAIIHIARAQSVYLLDNRVTGISLRFSDVEDAHRWKPLIASQFGSGYIVRSWYDMNQNFFQALKVEKSVMTILLALIILVAAFNIVSTLIMVVMEKTKDIGILRALGATRASIRKIFVYEGFSVGFLGVIVGALSGLAIAFNLNPIADFVKNTTGLEVFPSDIYFFDQIPVDVNFMDVILIVTFALIASVLAGLYPAHRATKLQPVEALRYE